VSANGVRATEAFASAFSARGVAVVSGMALGVDGRAHEATLDTGGLTMAVLGCGADIVYPPRHLSLYRRIAKDGIVASELPPGAAPAQWTFPHRNRLLAALGDGVLVVEASITSGALQTAARALEIGRPIFSVPGSIFVEGHTGCNMLLYDGAAPAFHPRLTVEDFLRQTRIERGRRRARRPRQFAGYRDSPTPHSGSAADARGLRVLEALASGPSSMDGLMVCTGLAARELNIALAELELGGLVGRAGPGIYIRAP
jgi:DNA processing protein